MTVPKTDVSHEYLYPDLTTDGSSSQGFEVEDLSQNSGEMADAQRQILIVETKLQDFMEKQRFNQSDDKKPLPAIPIPQNLTKRGPHEYPCEKSFSRLPAHPSGWPQAPVMLRPTPGSNTRVRGIRYSRDTTYQHFEGFCAGCILPINTGQEKPGQSLVVDFESDLFIGSLLMRIKDVAPTQSVDGYQQESYFDGKKRRFQAVVTGRFKKPILISECVTGQIFERPAGPLPAKFVVNTFIRFVSTLAPQLQVTLHGDQPRFATPLVATAHTVIARDCGDNSKHHTSALEDPIEEPSANEVSSVLQSVPGDGRKHVTSVSSRMKHRKRVFNRIAASQDRNIRFDTEKEYTFEFYQHLLLFTGMDDIKLDLGRPLGQAGLANPLNGQPIQFMAAHQREEDLKWLWSFDIWHQSLYALAKQALD